jgi:predicted GIY-YIG superfamily endonuclease
MAASNSPAEGHVYTLRLENKCYYVGWSSQINVRIAQHFLGVGSKWTKLHPPIEVLSVVQGDYVMEQATTIAMMCRHGWEKVRGGPWCSIELSCPSPIMQAKGAKRKHEAVDTSDTSGASTEQEAAPRGAAERREICQIKSDGEKCAWKATIYGEKASRECPVAKYKIIYGATLEDVTRKADTWENKVCSNLSLLLQP